MPKSTLAHIATVFLLFNLPTAVAASGETSYVPLPRYSLFASPAPDDLPAPRRAAPCLIPPPRPSLMNLDVPAPTAASAGRFSLAEGGAETEATGLAGYLFPADTDAAGSDFLPDHEEREGGDWRWRRAGGADYTAVSVVAVATAYFEHENGKPTKADWTSRNAFDESIRDALRLKSRSARHATSLAGDVIMGVMIAAPVLDSFAVLGIRGSRWDELWQTEMINLESFAFTSLVSSLMQNLLARERPFVRDCRGDVCESDLENRGMPSGHVAFAFTGAGLLCNHHAYQSLYDDPAADRAACAAGIGLAAVEGVLRIVADRHYATDVAVGTVIGLFSGFVLPRLLHYSHPVESAPEKNKTSGGLIERLAIWPRISSDSTSLHCEFRF